MAGSPGPTITAFLRGSGSGLCPPPVPPALALLGPCCDDPLRQPPRLPSSSASSLAMPQLLLRRSKELLRCGRLQRPAAPLDCRHAEDSPGGLQSPRRCVLPGQAWELAFHAPKLGMTGERGGAGARPEWAEGCIAVIRCWLAGRSIEPCRSMSSSSKEGAESESLLP